MIQALAYITAGVCGTTAILMPSQEQPAWVMMWLPAVLALTYAAIRKPRSG